MIQARDVPVYPGATHAETHRAALQRGHMSTDEHAVDASPADVVAFYVERLGPPSEPQPGGGAKWLFEETTERADEVGRTKVLVSVAPRKDGGTTLLIGTTSSTERRATFWGALRALFGR